MRILVAIFMFCMGIFAQDINNKYEYILDLYDKTIARVNLNEINQLKSPFYIEQIDQLESNLTDLKLEAIIENRVKIDSKWYEMGKDCQNLCIIEIKNTTVTILYHNKRFYLKMIEDNGDVKVF